MARYFMQLRGGTEELLDPEGGEFSSLAALREAVLFTARDLLTTDVRVGLMDFRLRIDAEDVSGEIVHTLHLKNAVEVVTSDRCATRRLIHPSWLTRSKEQTLR